MWQNFRIWRGRLPHWRADDVTYYATFRHRRDLTEGERGLLLRELLKPDGRAWRVLIACVLPERTELIVRVAEKPNGDEYELSKVLESAKNRAGKAIIKGSEERFSPFYTESFDRIIRDELELESRWGELSSSPVRAELAQSPEEYPALFVATGD